MFNHDALPRSPKADGEAPDAGCRTSSHARLTLGRWLLVVTALLLAPDARAEPSLPAIWSDSAVIRSGKPIRLWGRADPGERIAIRLAAANAVTVADGAGDWEVLLAPMPASRTPIELIVTGNGAPLVVRDLIVGEVWLAAGQSNMEYPIEYADEGYDAFIEINAPHLRVFVVDKRQTLAPQDDAQGRWVKLTPRAAPKVSAIGFFFARELSARTGRAVGIVQASYGGTPIEAWTPRETIEAPGYDAAAQAAWRKALADELRRRRAAAAALSPVWSAVDPGMADGALAAFAPPTWPDQTATARMATVLYNAMLHPIERYAIAGMLWYQGETNRPDGAAYGPKLKAFLDAMDARRGLLPVAVVQLAPYAWPVGGDPEDMPWQWQAQAEVARARARTGLIPTLDIADRRDIHPRRKRFTADRLAWWAAREVYGLDAPAYTGPMLRTIKREATGYRLFFDHAAGLRNRAGPDSVRLQARIGQGWTPVAARIDGETLFVAIDAPIRSLSYQWNRDAQPDLTNGEGVPAWPFRQDVAISESGGLPSE